MHRHHLVLVSEKLIIIHLENSVHDKDSAYVSRKFFRNHFFSFNTLVLVSEKLIIIGLENSIVTVLSITKILHIFQQALLKSTGF